MAGSLSEHPTRGVLQNILALQSSEAFSEESLVNNEKFVAARDKVFAMARVVDSLFERTAPELASVNGLANLISPVQQALNELTAFVSNKNSGHVTNAAAQFEQGVFPFLWAFAPPLESLSRPALGKLFAAQSDAATRAIEAMKEQESALIARLETLKTQADEQVLRYENLVAGSAKERAEAAAGVAKLEQQFTQEQSAREAEFYGTMSSIKEEFDNLEAGAREASSKTLVMLDEQYKQAAQIVQVVGNIGVTGNYKQIATSEAAQANFWRWATVGIFAVAIGLAVATFIKFWSQPINVENTLSIAVRLLYALAITGPAIYTARESARHRSNSDKAKQTELELASIGPFIELMPELKKVEIREKLIASYFGKGVDPHTVSNPVDLAVLKDFAVGLLKANKSA